MILASLLNSYPRIGERAAEQALRRAVTRVDRGEAPPSAIAEAEDEMTRLALREQKEAGLDLMTDGQIRWHDPVSHLASRLAGFRIKGLLRYFDTNTYYRQPEATGAIGREKPVLVEAYRFAAQAAAPVPVKAILTGPLTIARLSSDPGHRGVRSLAISIAEALNREALDLEAAGAAHIQIDEPALALFPGDLPIALEALPRLVKGLGRARTILATSFGDATPMLRDLAGLPVTMLGIDLLSARDATALRRLLPRDRGLLLGILDGRNTRLEDPGDVFERLLRPLGDALRGSGGPGGREIHLVPNHGLEFLPRDVAGSKMTALAAVRDRAREAFS
jgi:5-methyltetrahydropteroyltriglutamate--homocysteine methyltransferase